jgi:cellulose 1,4-beta-cellobiosidase
VVSNSSLSAYESEFINPIVDILRSNPNTAFALVIEPKSLTKIVTDDGFGPCDVNSVRDGVAYALKNLNLPNAIMYIDGGDGSVFGFDFNLVPGLRELARAYRNGGRPSQLRGFATNVAGWNSWDAEPGEFNATYGKYNKAQNEKKYVELLGNALKDVGLPNYAIVDTSRSGVQGLRGDWLVWCNVDGAGFGPRPTNDPSLELTDALVWVKPGDESDGASDPSATGYNFSATMRAYFEMLPRNPPLVQYLLDNPFAVVRCLGMAEHCDVALC